MAIGTGVIDLGKSNQANTDIPEEYPFSSPDLFSQAMPANAVAGANNTSSNTTSNSTPTTPPPSGDGTGVNRRWRGYIETDEETLKAHLPPQAKHLAKSFIEAGKTYDIDPLFLMAISKHETGAWTADAFTKGNNAMGISNTKGVVGQTSQHNSIMRQAASLAGAPGTAGYYKNAHTVAEVGAIYAPVGAENDKRDLNKFWPSSVGSIYDGYVNSIRTTPKPQ